MNNRLESNSVAAGLLELEVRFDITSKIQLFPPHVSVTLSEEDGLPLLKNERELFLKELSQKDDLVFVIWAEGPPRHFTWLHVRCTKKCKVKRIGDGKYDVTYKDPLAFPTDGNLEMAKRLLCNIGLPDAADTLAPSNRDHQADGWSCGVWCCTLTEDY